MYKVIWNTYDKDGVIITHTLEFNDEFAAESLYQNLGYAINAFNIKIEN